MNNTLCETLDAYVIQANVNFWKHLGAEIVRFDGATCIVGQLPFPESNKIFINRDKALCRKNLLAVFDFFEEKKLPYIWHLPKDSSSAAETFLNSHGFFSVTSCYSMILDVASCDVQTQATSVRKITTLEELQLINDIWQQSFSINQQASTSHLERLHNCYRLPNNPLQFYLAYSGNKAVGSGWLFCDETYAGIYYIATVPEARNKGIAKSVMQTLIQQAQNLGYKRLSLSALPAAKGIYERLGFYIVEEYKILKKGTSNSL